MEYTKTISTRTDSHSLALYTTMAERVVSIIFPILLALCLSTTALSRTLPPQNPKTTRLDVSSSIQKTLNLFSPQSANLDHTFSPMSSLSFQLHSRSKVQKAQHPDYRSLTLTRLARDSARAHSLQTRLDLAIHGIATTDLKPDGNENNNNVAFDDEEALLRGPVISGTSRGSGEYFSRVGIGRPPTQAYMVLDTGSDVNWVQCAPCADCYQQTDPIYQPTLSTSYSPLTCETKQCKSLDVSMCRNDTCLYEVSYGDGSYTVGDFVTETVTFSDEASVSNIAIGCGHNNEGLFVGAAGLIGLGAGALSFPSQINASSFSYCLVDRDSDNSSTLDFNSGTPNGAVTAPLLRNSKLDTFYYVDLTGMSVSGELVPIPETALGLDGSGDGGVIIDSGTAVTRLRATAYGPLRDAFVNGTKGLTAVSGGVALFDTCYDLSGVKSVEVPTVGLRFSNGKELALPAKNYLIPVDSNGTFCFAFAPTESSLSIVGNVQQQGTRVSFDIANSLVGFSPSSC